MKRSSTLFLKTILFLTAIVVTAFIIKFPQTEGRAANLDLLRIYTDPLIIYLYIASIPFFIGLYQAFILLNLIDSNKVFSQSAVDRLKNIKYSSISLICFIALALFYIRFFVHGEDSAGPTTIGIVVSLTFAVIATAAGVFQKLLEKAIAIKSENDLTV